MRYGAVLLSSFLTSALCGCAGMQYADVPDNKADQSANGFRYYDTSPFLLVITDGKGGLTSSVQFLPDTTKLRTVHPYAYAAKNDVTLKFDNGKLAQAKSVVDETIVPKAVLSSLEKVASSLIKAMNADAGKAAATEKAVPTPYLFRIMQIGDKWVLRGGIATGMDDKAAVIRYAN